MIQWLYRPGRNFTRRPLPRAGEEARFEPLAAFHRDLFPASESDPTQDYEDWVEAAVKLREAFATGEPVFLMDDREDPTRITASLTGHRFDPECASAVIGTHIIADPLLAGVDPDAPRGALYTTDHLRAVRAPEPHWAWDVDPQFVVWPRLEEAQLAATYYTLSAFRRNAGRRTALCAIPMDEDECDNSVFDVVADWTRQAPLAAMIKVVYSSKYGIVPANFPAKCTPRQALEVLFDALEFAVAHLEGLPGTLLLQDRIPMQHEYRIAVIDGRPVAGAGCIERFTPLNNTGVRFDPQTEEIRNNGRIQENPELVDRYVEAAHRIAQEISDEQPCLRDYTLDLAVRPDGEIVVIELNPTLNFGLYAMDFSAVLEAVAARELTRSREPAEPAP